MEIMSNKQTVRAFNGKILGTIETDSYGNKIVRNFYGKILGRYLKSLDVTRDFRGKTIARGDQSSLLLSLDKK
jgi:hypothetical protein